MANSNGGGLLSRLRARKIMMEGGDPIAAGRAAQGKKVTEPSPAASAAGLPKRNPTVRRKNGY